MQVMGVKVTTPDASPTTTTSDPQQQHYHLQKHAHQQQQQFLLKTSTFSLTVYLDPTTFQQTLPPMTFLSDPSPSSSSNKNSASAASPSLPKSHLVQNGCWKEQQDQQLPHPQLNQRSSVIGQDVNPSSPARGFSSSSPDKKRVRGGNSGTVIVDQGGVWSRSSLFLPVESDTNNNDEQHYNCDATAAQREQEDGEEERIGLGISKEPRRLSRHRYPHAMIHRLYNNNRPLRERGSRRRMVTMPKTTARTITTTRRIEAKKRPSRLQRLLLLLDQQEHNVNENFWPNEINYNNHHQQEQEQQRQGRNDPPAREDDLSHYSTDRGLAEMMNFILNDEELSKNLLANDNMLHRLTQNDIDMARALWDYWEELDAMDLIQAQLESQLEDENDDNHEDIDNIDYETHHPRQAQLRQRPEPQPFRSTLWKGRVKALVKDGTSNMSSSELMQDSISGLIMRFPFSGPMPSMPQNWIALMPCPVEESPELDLDQIGRKTPSLPLNASAIVFYATTNGDCRGYAETIDDEGDSFPPVMVLDALSAKRLILTLDSLSYGTTAMASLARTDLDSNAMATRISTTPIRADDNDSEETTDAGTREESTTLDSLDTIEKEELPDKAAKRPLRRQTVISMPELASMVDSFTAGAVIQARRVLVNLGLDTQDTVTDEQLDVDDDRRERGRDDADYYHPSTAAMLLKNGEVRARKAAYSGSEAADVDSHGLNHDRGQDKEKDKGKGKEGTASLAFILQRHSKTRTRPNRLSQHRHQASTQSQLLDQVQSLMLLKEYPQYSRGRQSLHHHHSELQHNNNLSLTYPDNTTMSGKVAMVLMSTICGVGVGMFGALLFVVALKVRLFQSRRSNNSGSGLHPLRHATAAQQQQAHQQMRESGVKKVIPLGVLESYGVQTVLQTSDATMVLTAVSEKSKAKMALLSKGPKTFAEDVIEMEEGLEDAEARANARRLRLERRRNRVGGPGQLRLGQDIEEEGEEEEEESGSGSDEAEYDDDDDVDEDLDQNEQDRYQEHGQYNDEEEDNGDQVVLEMRSSRDGGSMDMEQITAAIMTATRQGSYLRVSYSRQGHLNDSTSSLSSSYSSSSASSSSGSSSSSSSHSMERALTSSFSSSLSRSDNPQGCTHSTIHPHSHEQRRRTRGSRRRKTRTKNGKTLTEAKKKEELPFTNANAQTMCSICLAEYEVGEQVRTLPCYHQYHQGCIDPWLLNVAALCPICKRDLFPSPACGSSPSS
ncbi:hypothetical protein BGX30_013147 [Mortierella sp. GBA39]|nr:hypothetical protein BGX30_013147 [Mortierella sp. GBA39]